MSIEIEVKKLVLSGALIDRPSSYFRSRARQLYVTPEIDGYAQQPFPDTLEGNMLDEMAADLDAFSEMSAITVSENPYDKPWDTMLARVAPVADEFWSMRVVDPEIRPGIRILGGFCAKDAFVALHWDFREVIGTNFNEEVEEVRDSWRSLFGVLPPYSGNGLHDYLTNYRQQ